jgi:hypothetical protein
VAEVVAAQQFQLLPLQREVVGRPRRVPWKLAGRKAEP